VICPNEECCAFFERVPPTDKEKSQPVNDDDGRPILGDALAHYHTYRFRCRSCSTIFCSKCKKSPYHCGYTCESFEAHGTSEKNCRCCKDDLDAKTLPYVPSDGNEKEEKEKFEGEIYIEQQFRENKRYFYKARPKDRAGIFFWRKRVIKERLDKFEKEKQEFEKQEIERIEREKMEHSKKETERKESLEKKKKEWEEQQEEKRKVQEKARLESLEFPIYVCEKKECVEQIKERCLRICECKEKPCNGIAGELKCLPCIHPDSTKLETTEDDFCNICWIEDLAAKPCIELESCGHIFHAECVKKKLETKWVTPYISFKFMDCPLCNKRMTHPSLLEAITPFVKLEKYLKEKGVERLKIEGLLNNKDFQKGGKYEGKEEQYVLDKLAWYLCDQCRKPYYGGEKACGDNNNNNNNNNNNQPANFNPKELICGACSGMLGKNVCKEHGDAYMEWKCRFCCAIATFFCGGKAHFCTPCHNVPLQRCVCSGEWPTIPEYLKQAPKCDGAASCPLAINHPPNGVDEFCIGCAMCRSAAFRLEG